MIDHLGINCADVDRAAEFYDRTLAVLGCRRVQEYAPFIGYGVDKPDFWIGTFDGVGPNREVHVAFTASDAATVRAWYSEALAAGGESIQEPRMCRSTTRATSAHSSVTPTATTWRPCATPRRATAERTIGRRQ